MEHIGIEMEKLKQKLKDSGNLQSKKDSSQEKKQILKSTSKCPYKNCDGSGMILDAETNTAILCKCYYDQIVDKKLAFANIPENFKDLTINSFRTDLYERSESRQKAMVVKKMAANYVKNFETFQKKGKGLYLYSNTKGSGKTRMAISIGNALMKVKRKGVKYTTTIDLLDEIKKTFDKDSQLTESELIESIKKIDVLILDDVGVENPTPWVKAIFYSILDGRMDNNKITIFTSNMSMEELDHDDRLKSRIEKMAIPMEFPEESIRSKIARNENKELQRLLLE